MVNAFTCILSQDIKDFKGNSVKEQFDSTDNVTSSKKKMKNKAWILNENDYLYIESYRK